MDGMPFEGQTGERLRKALLVAVIVLAIFLAVEVVGGVMQWRYIGAGVAATNTITVSGHGEAVGIPDIATFTFSVVSDKATVAAAQSDATQKANAATQYLTSQGISKNDIQTSDYSVQPQYEYQSVACPANGYCPPGNPVLKGYEVRQTTTVKVRDTSKAGDLLSGVGGTGATEVSGLTFTFDDPTSVQTDARTKAIDDAKQKADALAKELGVSLVRVTAFNESPANAPRPMMYATAGAGSSAKDASAPEISVGQNKVEDDVSVTYEIR